jgi:hypothetical protein
MLAQHLRILFRGLLGQSKVGQSHVSRGTTSSVYGQLIIIQNFQFLSLSYLNECIKIILLMVKFDNTEKNRLVRFPILDSPILIASESNQGMN